MARDVYRSWRSALQSALDSVVIFTPYFDGAISRLLSAVESVPREHITIVTTFDPTALIQLPAQLRELKKLISSGFRVLHIDLLHAKILIVDDKVASVGSQNFTVRGRRNREATTLTSVIHENAAFVRQLCGWLDDAVPIDLAAVEELLSAVSSDRRRLSKIGKTTEIAVQTTLQRLKARVGAELERRNLAKAQLHADLLKKQSRLEFEGGDVRATVVWAKSSEWALDAEYVTLKATRCGDFTKWISVDDNGFKRRVKLGRLDWYPVYFTESGTLAYARLGKTQITYFRTGAWWKGRIYVGNDWCWVNVEFPAEKHPSPNIRIELTAPTKERCTLSCICDGLQFEVAGVKYHIKPFKSTRRARTFFSQVEFNQDHFKMELFRKLASPWRPRKDRRSGQGVRAFLAHNNYMVNVVECLGTPMLIATPID
ncbi:MAG: phosphatidylserine/phosphatidylglycerophosphate/cardiolipin synthase family protein [Verrucomicrobiaceae bacterium]|nr:phosphatidylserine/phosphatidylglycerophosphate/cardiolipin synthase family protein [Verrucomicrobiaceae bacterium]